MSNLEQIAALYEQERQARAEFMDKARDEWDQTESIPYRRVMGEMIQSALDGGVKRSTILAAMGTTNYAVIRAYLSESKPNQRKRIVNHGGTLNKIIHDDMIEFQFTNYLLGSTLIDGSVIYRQVSDGAWLPDDPSSDATVAVEDAITRKELTIP